MKCTYNFKAVGKCPSNPSVVDEYDVEITTTAMVLVEEIHETVGRLTAQPIYQENFTVSLFNELPNVESVKVWGVHQGIETVSSEP